MSRNKELLEEVEGLVQKYAKGNEGSELFKLAAEMVKLARVLENNPENEEDTAILAAEEGSMHDASSSVFDELTWLKKAFVSNFGSITSNPVFIKFSISPIEYCRHMLLKIRQAAYSLETTSPGSEAVAKDLWAVSNIVKSAKIQLEQLVDVCIKHATELANNGDTYFKGILPKLKADPDKAVLYWIADVRDHVVPVDDTFRADKHAISKWLLSYARHDKLAGAPLALFAHLPFLELLQDIEKLSEAGPGSGRSVDELHDHAEVALASLSSQLKGGGFAQWAEKYVNSVFKEVEGHARKIQDADSKEQSLDIEHPQLSAKFASIKEDLTGCLAKAAKLAPEYAEQVERWASVIDMTLSQKEW